MKLFQVNVVVNSGSTGRIAEELGKLAIHQGWESYIGTGRYPLSSSSELIKIGSSWEMYQHILETRLFDNHGFSSERATKNLITQIKEINPDIIHLHNVHGYFVNIQLLFEFLSKFERPVVWTLHDCWAFTGHCAFYEYVGCEKWKTECHHCPQIHSYPKSWWVDNSSNNYRQKKQIFTSLSNLTLVPVSDWLANQLKSSFLRTLPVKRIHNGLDISKFTPDQELNADLKNKLEGKFVILGVANLWEEKRKGLADFCELSALLSDDDVIVLVGIKKDLLKRLPANIIGIERTENVSELSGLYANSNVLFNPTWEDNFPTTNLEALACGTPVITYATGGSVEVITADTGFVIQKGDIKGALDAIKSVKEKGFFFYSDKCRKYAVTNFNKDDRFQEYFDLYETLLRKAGHIYEG